MQLSTKSNFTPMTLDDAIKASELFSKSNLIPNSYKGKPEDILVAIILGNELGMSPITSLQSIATINGKPSIYGDAMLALVQSSPVCMGVAESFFKAVKQEDCAAVCIAYRKNRDPVTVSFSIGDAIRAGLWKKAGPWTQYPKRMLQMRARSFALRDAFPDVLRGLIAVEEAEDYLVNGATKHTKPNLPMANPLDIMEIDEDGVIQMEEENDTKTAAVAANN
jgi:hypothetical protein